MSGRQLGLGKLRQWAGEVISTTRDKAIVTDEFSELEQDIELRKEGATRLHGACEAYQQALTKKKFSEAVGGSDKIIPIDGLGLVMSSHGEQFPEDSQYGSSLVKLGRAHSTIAELQQTFGHQFKDTFIAAIEQFREEIKEYEGLRKQLDSRRGALESATTKFEKLRNSKKEKDRREAEDDLERAQQRYDETIEDMRAHMESLQEHEVTQERALSAFLDLEINFVQQYLDVLKGVRGDWSSGPSSMRPSKSSQSRVSMTPVLPPRTIAAAVPRSSATLESSEDEEYRPPSRGSPKKHRKSDSAPSRSSSRLSRRRTNSSVTSTDKNKSDKEDKPRRLSVAGWASSAVDSISSRSKKSKDVESFSSLGDGPDKPIDRDTEKVAEPAPRRPSFSLSRRSSSKRKKSKDNLQTQSPVGPPRLLKPPSLQDKKTVKALYDFQGSTDELTFKAGTEIKVLNEVVDGWWMGEIDGQKGLFPTTHVSSTSPKQSPSIPHRPYRADEDSGHDLGRHADGYLTSDLEEEFGHQLPLAHSRSPFYAGFNDVASIASDHQIEPDSPWAVKAARRFSDDLDQYIEAQTKATPKVRNMLLQRDDDDGDIASAPLLRSQSEGPPSPVNTLPRKPPPPPPRRIPGFSQTSSPAIPERRLGPAMKPVVPPRPAASNSTDSVKLFNPYATSSANTSSSLLSTSAEGLDYDVSPFESAAELSGIVGGQAANAGVSKGCGKFTPNPFLPKGMCNACKTFHT